MPQLSRPQLEAALHYYRHYSYEVDERLKWEEEAAIELEQGPFIRLVEI